MVFTSTYIDSNIIFYPVSHFETANLWDPLPLKYKKIQTSFIVQAHVPGVRLPWIFRSLRSACTIKMVLDIKDLPIPIGPAQSAFSDIYWNQGSEVNRWSPCHRLAYHEHESLAHSERRPQNIYSQEEINLYCIIKLAIEISLFSLQISKPWCFVSHRQSFPI